MSGKENNMVQKVKLLRGLSSFNLIESVELCVSEFYHFSDMFVVRSW